MEPINQDLVKILYRYAKRTVSEDVLRQWLAEHVWDLMDSPSPLDRMLIGEVEIALGEYDRGDRSEASVRDHVLSLLRLPNPDLSPVLRELAASAS